MNRTYRDTFANAEVTLNYVNGLLNVEDQDDPRNNTKEDALSYCYSFLIQKKVQWSIHVEKLAELFLQLAFETEKHSKNKEVLRQYRAITQNQHPQSLRHILQYFRDNKIQAILQEEIPQDSLEFIRNMQNIQDDEASSEIIISSFNPVVKNQRQKIREKLKIVWEGYKAIIDIVRVNIKLEAVYKTTLKKIFDFVNTYNRKGQFKSFCEYLRTGLKIALNKRDKTEQQKGFYIDIEKEQVNTNNIEIRLQQFNITTKLGLWQQSFHILEDIKELIRVRKGPIKNYLKCSYFEKLALIFRKSNYWHYHAYALFNYYIIYITKSKLSSDQKIKLSDKLLLSVLCIPPSTLQSHQSKEAQEKIGQMMIYGTKIPDRQQLHDMMVSRGIVENASKGIKDLWYFMFLEFDLSSLKNGLQLLKKLENQKQYEEYVPLLEDILIYKQLISVAQVYQRMKYSSLLRLIPLDESKIEKILLECHNRKVIDFTLDQKKGIISFQQKNEETNPLEEFYYSYIQLALLREQIREMDKNFIVKKSLDFMNDSDNYYWKIRQYKIDQYEEKLKKPKDELNREEKMKKKKKEDQKKREEDNRRIRQAEIKEEQQRKKEELINKKVYIEDLMKVKEQRVVRIAGKRIEKLTDEDIQGIQLDVFKQLLQQTKVRVANDNENRNKKKFLKVDYMQRERRTIIESKTKSEYEIDQRPVFQRIKNDAKEDFEQKQNLKTMISKVAPEVKNNIDSHYEKNKAKFEDDLAKFKKNLEEQFRIKVIKRAKQLHRINEQNKRIQNQRRKEEEMAQSNQKWAFRQNSVSTPSAPAENQTWARKTTTSATTQEQPKAEQQKKPKESWFKKSDKKANAFQDLQIKQDPEDKKDWTRKKVEEKKEEPSKQGKFIPPPVAQSKGAWGKGTAKESNKEKQPQGGKKKGKWA